MSGAFVGNAGRGILTGPGSATVDLVLEKRFRLSERANVQFRSEAYNLFNRVNFGLPNGSVFLNGNIQANGSRGTVIPQVGQITTTRGNPRQLQFGLRVEF